jgi:DNA-binding SARP family transcriptional activator
MDGRWRIELLGELKAIQGDRVVTRFRTQKTAALLAYLAYHRHRSHPRQVLIELLWPEGDVDAGRHNLSVALNALRDQLEPADTPSGTVLVTDRFSVGLNANAVTTDVTEFEAALDAAAQVGSSSEAERVRWLIEAVERYRGTLLPGFYEDWILPEQQRLDERFFQALGQLVTYFKGAREWGRALQYARQALAVDPLREETYEELMRLHLAAGQPSAALRVYRELERVLKQQLDMPPGATACALAEEITDRSSRASDSEGGESSAERGGSDLEVGATSPPDTPSTVAGAPAPVDSMTMALPSDLEPVGGAVPPGSPFYITRPIDAEFGAAIDRQDSIVLVSGTRQVGKTSLLARGLQRAREAGARVVVTDLQIFNAAHLTSADAFLLAVAETIAEQLDLDTSAADVWDPRRGANPNFRRFLRREVLGAVASPLVWGLDEIDRLFNCDYASEIFGLFRSWHNERALDPAGPWSRLTLAIAYATEAQLFITDVNQSPFNVGTRFTLEDFSLDQVAELNRRYGSPLKNQSEVARYYELVSGHPYLVRRGLHEMATHGTEIAEFEARADHGKWIFADHLRRILVLLGRDPELCDVVRGVLEGRPCPTPESFYRLRTAGVISGDSEQEAQLRCELYARYLRRHLL